MIRSLLRAFDELSNPVAWWVVLGCVASVILLGILLSTGAWMLLSSFQLISLPWLDTTVDVLGTGASAVLAWFLLPVLSPILASLFVDIIAARIEKRDYPAVISREVTIPESIAVSLKTVFIALVLNIIALPFYFVPLIGQIAYYTINGYLLGREFFETVAIRYHPHAEVVALRKLHTRRLIIAGVFIAVIFTIPVLNLFGPILATAFMVHYAMKIVISAQ